LNRGYAEATVDVVTNKAIESALAYVAVRQNSDGARGFFQYPHAVRGQIFNDLVADLGGRKKLHCPRGTHVAS